MKIHKIILLLIATTLISLHTNGAPYQINQDTTQLNKKQFKNPETLKNAVDSIYKYKKENLSNALKQIKFMCNRASELKNKGVEAKAINVKAGIFADLGDYESALKLHYQALGMFEKAGIKYSVAMTTSNIGRVYMDYGKLDDAILYFSKAETLANEGGFKKVLIYVFDNLTNAYIQKNKLPEALKAGLKADSLCKALGEPSTQPPNFNNIGAIYFFLQDYDKALAYYQKAKTTALQLKDSVTYYRSIINISEVDDLKQIGDPVAGYELALQYFDRIKDYTTVAYVSHNLFNYYEVRNNYKLALKYQKQEVKATEQYKNLQAINNIALLQTKFETEKKQQEIKLLNSENTVNRLSIASRNKTIAIISGLLIISLIISALVYNRKNLKQKAALEKKEFEHRNMLAKAVIDAEEDERKRIGSDLHDGVGQLFSAVKMNLSGLFDRINIENTAEKFLAEKTLALVDESCKEVRIISHKMMPNTLLKSGIASDIKSFIEKLDETNLKVNFEATGFSDQLEHNEEVILYKVIQELVSNIIKHAQASELTINLYNQKDFIKAIVKDNGVGFSTDKLSSFDGIGLKNIKTRIDYLKGTITYVSAPNAGTSVEILVPTNL